MLNLGKRSEINYLNTELVSVANIITMRDCVLNLGKRSEINDLNTVLVSVANWC